MKKESMLFAFPPTKPLNKPSSIVKYCSTTNLRSREQEGWWRKKKDGKCWKAGSLHCPDKRERETTVFIALIKSFSVSLFPVAFGSQLGLFLGRWEKREIHCCCYYHHWSTQFWRLVLMPFCPASTFQCIIWLCCLFFPVNRNDIFGEEQKHKGHHRL